MRRNHLRRYRTPGDHPSYPGTKRRDCDALAPEECRMRCSLSCWRMFSQMKRRCTDVKLDGQSTARSRRLIREADSHLKLFFLIRKPHSLCVCDNASRSLIIKKGIAASLVSAMSRLLKIIIHTFQSSTTIIINIIS